jgi:hypothetical protein
MAYIKAQEAGLDKGVGFVDPGTGAYGYYDPKEDDWTDEPTTPIHVNEARIDSEKKDALDQLIAEAAVIIHEMTHHRVVNDDHKRGAPPDTSESKPKAAEQRLTAWVRSNKDMLKSKFPELQSLR